MILTQDRIQTHGPKLFLAGVPDKVAESQCTTMDSTVAPFPASEAPWTCDITQMHVFDFL